MGDGPGTLPEAAAPTAFAGMLFNSNVFLQFLLAFLLLYWLVRGNLAARNLLVVAASYLFYGWWDYRFLGLLFISSLLDFGVGRALDRTDDPRRRKRWLSLSLSGNLGILGFFKYYNFFVDSFATLLREAGMEPSLSTLRIVLPVGISFYTFQTLSYALDVYRRQIPATRNFVEFLAYVSFFPQLVAGPIERASNLLPQFQRTVRTTPAMFSEGIWLMIWGMFKKVVVADSLAPLADMAFAQTSPGGALVVLGTVAFALQIYGDFSGYSDIARGLAKVLGFELMVNFNLPYAANNIREFWRRWHISLSTWLRDYLYIPLGGNRLGPSRTSVNLLLTMLLGGLWHGAAWNFVFWGAWHGFGLLVYRWWSERRPESPRGWHPVAWAGTMAFVLYGWLLFRATSMAQVAQFTLALGDGSLPPWMGSYVLTLAWFALPLAAMQAWQARSQDLLAPVRLKWWWLALLEGVLLAAVLLYWERDASPFIYFQF